MNYQKLAGILCMGFVSLGLASVADAALLGHLPTTPGGTDFQAYYDNTANLTWLANANAGAGTAFDDGPKCGPITSHQRKCVLFAHRTDYAGRFSRHYVSESEL